VVVRYQPQLDIVIGLHQPHRVLVALLFSTLWPCVTIYRLDVGTLINKKRNEEEKKQSKVKTEGDVISATECSTEGISNERNQNS